MGKGENYIKILKLIF